MYSDFAELDLLLTKDNKAVVFHDRYLSDLTDISLRNEFASRKRFAQYDMSKGKGEESKEDWWVIDFTLEELKTLRVKQDNFKRPKL